MNKIAIIFGGSGYIGRHLLRFFIKKNTFEKYYVYDLKPLEGFKKEIQERKVEYLMLDVREKINCIVKNIDTKNSWVFNFAAIHREPGHEYQEYFDTNIPGAENINAFAIENKIKNIFFTSSIAPYGKSLQQRTECSNLYPETAYGISKAFAEKIHLNWLNEKRLITYNYAENPVIPLNEMVTTVKKELKIKKPTLKLPVWLLSIIARFFQVGFKLIGKKSDIHPVRVRKAGFPTNIKPQYLIDNGFDFKYGFKNSLVHWKKVSPEDFD